MKKAIIVVLCMVWIGFIFSNSTKTATVSNQKSYSVLKVAQNIYHEFEKLTDIHFSRRYKNKQKLNLILRKSAHTFEYMMLCIIVSVIFYFGGSRARKLTIYALFTCLLIAVFDEWYQSFVPGRGSCVRDVLIDFGGSIIGIGVFNVVRKIVFLLRNKKLEQNL